MKVHFRRGTWIVRDIIEIIAIAYREKNENEEYVDSLVKKKKEVLKAIEKAGKLLDFEDRYLGFFVDKAFIQPYRDFITKKMYYADEVEDIISINQEIDAYELRRQIIENQIEIANEIEGKDQIIYDENSMKTVGGISDILEKLELDNREKWMLFDFCRNPEKHLDEFQKILQRFIPQYKKIMEKHRKRIEKFEDKIQEMVDTQGVDIYRDILKEFFDYEYVQNLYISSTFIESQGMRINLIDNDVYIYVGSDVEESLKAIRGKGELENVLNVISTISDPIKFKILGCMREKEVYGREICEVTGLSKAALSYHIAQLTSIGLIKVNKIGNKIYYSAKKEFIEDSIDKLRKYF